MASPATTTATKEKVSKEYVPATKAEIANAIERMTIGRITMLIKQPFFGNIATRLELVVDETIPTAATCGRRIYFNPKFVNMLRDGEIVFLLGHEVLHVIFDHLGRFRDIRANPMISNIAADFVVNDFCVENRIGEKIATVPVLYDKKYHGWAFEEVYEDLMKQAEEQLQKMAGSVLDEHVDGQPDDADGDANGDGQPGSGKYMTDAEFEEMRNEMREAIVNAAKSVDPGCVPAEIMRAIKELTEPKLDWRAILRQKIESQVKSDFTFMRPGRRSWAADAMLQSTTREPAIECSIAIDASGSMSAEMLRDILSEVVGITQQYAAFQIDILSFDTKVYNHQEFNEMNVDDLYDYQIQGGGGTAFKCVFDYLADRDVKQLIMLTDGYPSESNWGDSTGAWDGNTTFLIHGDRSQKLKSPWGESIHYETSH